jgi:hypothetical protein
MPPDQSTIRRGLRSIWNNARAITDNIPNSLPACATCIDFARGQRIRFRDPDEGRSIEGYPTCLEFAKSALSDGPSTLNGCHYCGVIMLAIYLQADFLIRENGSLRIHFPLYGGVVILDSNLGRAEMIRLRVYTPSGSYLIFIMPLGNRTDVHCFRPDSSVANIVRLYF